MSRTLPANRYVYVIGPPVGLQKVGIATDPKQRLATFQTACPFDLFLHLAVAVPFGEAHAIERQAHRLLAPSCVRNEWIETTAKEAIAAVQKAVAGWPARSALNTPIEWLGHRSVCLHETRVRRWARGLMEIPPKVAAWLETLAAVHAAHPMPAGWSRQAA